MRGAVIFFYENASACQRDVNLAAQAGPIGYAKQNERKVQRTMGAEGVCCPYQSALVPHQEVHCQAVSGRNRLSIMTTRIGSCNSQSIT